MLLKDNSHLLEENTRIQAYDSATKERLSILEKENDQLNKHNHKLTVEQSQFRNKI